MLNPEILRERFRQNTHIVDGGLATELEHRGHDITGKLWSGHALLENPKAIEELHYDYLVAGADILITASYQLSLQGMVAAGYSHQEYEQALNLSVQCALSARQRWQEQGYASSREQPLIAASIGPYGAYLANGSEYTGDYDIGYSGLIEFHRDRLDLMVNSGSDFLAIETLPSLTEALAVIELLKAFGNPPAWISFSCCDAEHLSDGTPAEDASRELMNCYPDLLAIGVNCTPPQYVKSLLEKFAAATNTNLLAYPNSGEQWDSTERCWYGENDPKAFSDYAKSWMNSGASIVGGCCRTNPCHISGLRENLISN